MATPPSAPRGRWARRLVVALVVAGTAALGVGVFLQASWLRLDEVPWVVRDVLSRTAYEPRVVAQPEDFAALEEGAAAALALAPELFPAGLAGVDFALYDSGTLYVYAHRAEGGVGTVRGSWRDFTVVATPLWASPTRRSLKACLASEGYANWSRVRAVTRSEVFFMCAPLSSFVALQRGNSIYDTRESYLATVVHEFAHQYLALHPDAAPATALAVKLDRLPPTVDRERVLDEAYATWAELRASRRLFPAHFERLRTDFLSTSCRDFADEPHCLGLRLALEVIADEPVDGPDAG